MQELKSFNISELSFFDYTLKKNKCIGIVFLNYINAIEVFKFKNRFFGNVNCKLQL